MSCISCSKKQDRQSQSFPRVILSCDQSHFPAQLSGNRLSLPSTHLPAGQEIKEKEKNIPGDEGTDGQKRTDSPAHMFHLLHASGKNTMYLNLPEPSFLQATRMRGAASLKGEQKKSIDC